MLVVTLCNITTSALYGTGGATGTLENSLDVVSFVFMMLAVFETFGRVGAAGWKNFWYVNDDFFQQCTNRFDWNVCVLTLFTLVVGWIAKASDGRGVWFEPWGTLNGYNDWARLALAIPLLRAFSTVRIIRDIVMGMLTVFPSYLPVITLLVLLLYGYGVLGCLLFASDFKFYGDGYDIPDANFNSLGDALVTLFQLFVGEAWNDVLYAAMNTGKSFQAILYFISFILVITLLFTNLIIGIICSGYDTISEIRAEILEQAERRKADERRDREALRRARQRGRGGADLACHDDLTEEFGGGEAGAVAVDGGVDGGEGDSGGGGGGETTDKIGVRTIVDALKQGELKEGKLHLEYTLDGQIILSKRHAEVEGKSG